MHFILRLFSLFLLTIGIIAGVVDALQTVATDKLVLTPLKDSWTSFHPESLDTITGLITPYLHPVFLDPILNWILLQPTAAVFFGLALLFYLIAYRRVKPEDQYAV